ncbi:hypothetical protein [Vibrio harveyi]|uniref:hypothetical protein n=1 Tax=Vibrio harveyi TaxID=669 RepID=UPI00238004F6|nr:hypothetical protein [Vibrio harveyi]
MTHHNDFPHMDIDYLNELEGLQIFMSGEQLYKELLVMIEALRTLTSDSARVSLNRKPTREEISSVVDNLLSVLDFSYPPSPDDIVSSLRSAFLPHQGSKISLLFYCFSHCGVTLETVQEDHNIHTFLVPNIWKLRWEELLGGHVHPVVVGYMPVYSFHDS